MRRASGNSRPILIVGAGPVGLVTALALGQQGIPVRVFEREVTIPPDVRASTLHCATLDLLAPLGITRRLLDIGYQVRFWQLRDRETGVVAEWDLEVLKDDTGYPFRIACEQPKLANVALQLLKEVPNVSVQFGATFVRAERRNDGVVGHFSIDGNMEAIEGNWLIGADGGRSAVRKTTGIEFEGFTWPEQFLSVGTHHDFTKSGYAFSNYIADPEEWVAIFKVPHDGPPGLWRIMFPARPEVSLEDLLSDEYIEEHMQAFQTKPVPYEIKYRNVYKVHQRVAKSFRAGRIVLAGDAAHVNNPVGALGLNGGLQDAVNLAEKLGLVFQGLADDDLIDRYDRQRRTTCIESIQAQSIRNKRFLEERDPLVRAERQQEMRVIASDRDKARDYLLGASMITSVRKSNSIS
jgi:3-(3-hydroxy-phenyl)propionate hydroxylase